MSKLIAFGIIVVWVVSGCTSRQLNSEWNLKPHVILIQPIVVQDDNGNRPAYSNISLEKLEFAYQKANVKFQFLETITFNNTRARDGIINLDTIVVEAKKAGVLRGQGDIINLFFVNAVDGQAGPLGRGMFDGHITFVAMNNNKASDQALIDRQSFAIAHEIGHNLALKHAIDDPNVPTDIPNLQGDGPFIDRINPKYSLNDYQLDVVHKSKLVWPRISFLSGKQAEDAIIDESFEPYFSKLQKREISACLNESISFESLEKARDYAKQRFSSAVLPFSEDEKAMLTYYIKKTINLLKSNGYDLIAGHPWRFIKVSKNLCGGFSHTRGLSTILNESTLNRFLDEWKAVSNGLGDEDTFFKKLGGLLVHEQMHSLQRSYPKMFRELYTNYWNFIEADVQPEDSLFKSQLSNPDAPIARWLTLGEDDHSLYWIRVLIKEGNEIPLMGKDFLDVVIPVNKINDEYFVSKNEDGAFSWFPLSEFSYYVNSFPVTRGLDHPNEISAYMFSDVFKSLVDVQPPFLEIKTSSKSNADKFLSWLSLRFH